MANEAEALLSSISHPGLPYSDTQLISGASTNELDGWLMSYL